MSPGLDFSLERIFFYHGKEKRNSKFIAKITCRMKALGWRSKKEEIVAPKSARFLLPPLNPDLGPRTATVIGCYGIVPPLSAGTQKPHPQPLRLTTHHWWVACHKSPVSAPASAKVDRNGTIVHCWWESKLVQPLRRTA